MTGQENMGGPINWISTSKSESVDAEVRGGHRGTEIEIGQMTARSFRRQCLFSKAGFYSLLIASGLKVRPCAFSRSLYYADNTEFDDHSKSNRVAKVSSHLPRTCRFHQMSAQTNGTPLSFIFEDGQTRRITGL
jgi:hypothetical protein